MVLNPSEKLFIDPELVNLIDCLIHTNIDIGFVVEVVTLIGDQGREMMLRQRKSPKNKHSIPHQSIIYKLKNSVPSTA